MSINHGCKVLHRLAFFTSKKVENLDDEKRDFIEFSTFAFCCGYSWWDLSKGICEVC